MNEIAERHNRFRLPARAATVGLVALAVAVGFAGGRATLAAATQPATVAPLTGAADSAPAFNAPSYSAVVERAAPAVVTVRVEKHAGVSRSRRHGCARQRRA